MRDDDTAQAILAFARQLQAGTAAAGAAELARARRWIDAAGRPTEEGVRLVEALHEQRRTRSTFRLAV